MEGFVLENHNRLVFRTSFWYYPSPLPLQGKCCDQSRPPLLHGAQMKSIRAVMKEIQYNSLEIWWMPMRCSSRFGRSFWRCLSPILGVVGISLIMSGEIIRHPRLTMVPRITRFPRIAQPSFKLTYSQMCVPLALCQYMGTTPILWLDFNRASPDKQHAYFFDEPSEPSSIGPLTVNLWGFAIACLGKVRVAWVEWRETP